MTASQEKYKILGVFQYFTHIYNCVCVYCQDHTLLEWKLNFLDDDSLVRGSMDFVIFEINWSDTIRQPLFSTLLYQFELSVNDRKYTAANDETYSVQSRLG